MKSYCIKDHFTGQVLKILLTEEEFQEFLRTHPNIDECIDCIECDDVPSICIE